MGAPESVTDFRDVVVKRARRRGISAYMDAPADTEIVSEVLTRARNTAYNETMWCPDAELSAAFSTIACLTPVPGEAASARNALRALNYQREALEQSMLRKIRERGEELEDKRHWLTRAHPWFWVAYLFSMLLMGGAVVLALVLRALLIRQVEATVEILRALGIAP